MTRAHLKSRSRTRAGFLAGLGALLVATTAVADSAGERIEAIRASREIPEESLLDVGIEVFDPGLPPGDGYALEQQGIFEDIRKSEARFLAVSLMDTLQATGNWGAVRVVPAGTGSVDLEVSGRIVESSGRKLELDLRAVDATGREWLSQRYKRVADPRAYAEEEIAREPFQDLFNEVANDLLAVREKLEIDDMLRIREIAGMKFAADLAPVAFADYLTVDRKGRTVAERLPAEDDPLIARMTQIRERDHLFVDTLTDHYVNFSAQMSEPYDHWRKFSYEEEVARRKLQRKARMQKVFGALGILGAVLADGSSREKQAMREAGVIAGSMAIRAGMANSQGVKLHLEALRELASSFDSEVAPLLVEVEGQTLRLSGSIETQYATWRQLMRDFFVAETGFPVDPDTGDPVPSDASGE